MSDDLKRKIRKYARGAAKWETAAVATKIAFEQLVSPVVGRVSDAVADAVANAIQHPVMEVVEVDQLVAEVRKQLARTCVIVLGSNQSGKSSLLRYLAHGTPIKGRLKSDLWEVSDTFQGVISVSETSPPVWKDIIQGSRPTGIVYMVDPRKGASTLSSQIAELGKCLLDTYHDSPPPKALHLLLNFADEWRHTPSDQRELIRFIEEELARQFPDTVVFVPRSMRVAAVQLSPSSREWPEVKNAIDHLGADLGL